MGIENKEENKNWVWYENAAGECLKGVCGKDKVTKPKFKATDRQDNDTCHAEQHSHCPPSSKTSNPDWIVEMPDDRWVVDAKYHSASKVNAHDVDKLLSDKKSHGAKIGILMVYVDGSCCLPISPNVQEMAQQHGILIVPFTGQNPDKKCMALLEMIKKRANFSPQVQKSMKLIDAGRVEPGLKVLSQTIRKISGTAGPLPFGDASSASMALFIVLDIVKNGTLVGMSRGGLPNMMSFISAGSKAATGISNTFGFGRTFASASPASAAFSVATVAVRMSLVAVEAIAWGVKQARAAHAALQEAKKVSEYLKQSSKEVAEFEAQVLQLEKELDEYSEILFGMDAKLEKGSEEYTERFWALAELNLLVTEKIPSLLSRMEDVAQNICKKAGCLKDDLEDAERREANARLGQDHMTGAAIGSGVAGGLGTGLSFLGIIFPPILAVTVPLAIGGTGTAIETGIAADRHGKTKKLAQEQIQSIKDQIGNLEKVKRTCLNLHAKGTELLQSAMQKLLLPSSKL